MKRKTIIKHGRRAVLAGCGLLIGAMVTQSCQDDVLTGQPEWLGNSIYERLQDDGNYTTVLRLIDDLGQAEVLGHTGSKTLFAADDQAYKQWFQGNSWGVTRYEQLSNAQKKLLLNSAMINNAYLIELMSNAKAQGDGATPEEGQTMRRETAVSIYDSVYIMPADKMPNTPAWKELKEKGKAVPIFRDATTPPMIHFLPAFMSYQKITDEDLAILTNHQATSIAEAWVNGKRVSERDITCKNGYIQKVDGVIEMTPNMAEIIHQHENMSTWAYLIDRYSAPYYDATLTREYNRIYNNEDSAYVMRYFSDKSAGNAALETLPNGDPAKGKLRFDPGWNQYNAYTSSDTKHDLHNEAGMMIVPTNQAFDEWWNGEGRDLQDEYKVLDSIPDATLSKLIRNNMIATLSEHVPSKFATVLNDAMESMGIQPADVDSCFMGCNGVVYLVNKVFTPAEYSSVAYPALAHASTMNVCYWAIDQRNFLPYLLSMDSKYALVIPTNDALMKYIDPASYGSTNILKDQSGADSITVEAGTMFEFWYDETKSSSERVQARRYPIIIDENGNISKTADRPTQTSVARNVINTVFDQILDQLIIVIPDKTKTLEDYISEGYTYFKTKGGSMMRITKGPDGNLQFQGGWQMEHKNCAVPATDRFPKTNGVSYKVETVAPMGAQNSMYTTLQKHPEYNGFFGLIENDYNELLVQKLNNKYVAGLSASGSKNLRILDNYNYTVYIPSNESIEKLQADKILPTWDEMMRTEEVLDSICLAERWYEYNNDREAVRNTLETVLKELVQDFVRYHVQDHSLAIGMAKDLASDGNYESMKRNPETGRFYPIKVDYDTKSMTVTDAMGNVRHVITTDGLYNNVCREYWFEGTGNTSRLFMGSDVVVHLIDAPLFYQNMKPWRELVKEALNP